MSQRPVVLLTGGAGFIGSALIRRLVRDGGYAVLNLDALTYAGNLESLPGIVEGPAYQFVHGDIGDAALLGQLFAEYRPEGVIHLAAESHVDRSIDGPGDFIRTNVLGTYTLLQEALRYWRRLEGVAKDGFRFHHVSTDEVFGSLGESGAFTEETPYRPNSPYSASKASSDHLVRAWHYTYGLPTVMTNCSNNYGPYQFPEKLIPLMIQRGLTGESLPVYGQGANVRDWLYVDDHVEALLAVFTRGRCGETYNVGGGAERRNLDVVRAICALLDELRPRADGERHAAQITFVADRPGHDLRYAIDATKIEKELGWRPKESFESGLRRTVEWYLANAEWTSRVMSGAYRGERIGLGEAL